MSKARSRRGHGEGSVYQRADGYWCAAVEAGRCPGGETKRDGTVCRGGERLRVRVVRRTKKAVLDELDELKRRGAAGVVGGDPTTGEYLRWWLDNIKAADVAAGTFTQSSLDSYRKWSRSSIEPHVGHIRLRKLTATHVVTMMNNLAAAGVAPRSRNVARGLLAGALRYAKGAKLILDNPCDHVPGAKLGAKLDDALTLDEVERALAAAQGDRLYALLHLASTLGQRQGELLALRWADVDLEAGVMTIVKAKTRSGERTLPLVAGCHEVLREHRRRQAAERLQVADLWQDRDLVFPSVDGTPVDPRTLRTWWYEVQERAGIEPRRRFHALRHTAVQAMLDRGVPLEVVSAVAGHSGIAITADVYGKARSDRMRRSLTRYDEAGS